MTSKEIPIAVYRGTAPRLIAGLQLVVLHQQRALHILKLDGMGGAKPEEFPSWMNNHSPAILHCMKTQKGAPQRSCLLNKWSFGHHANLSKTQVFRVDLPQSLQSSYPSSLESHKHFSRKRLSFWKKACALQCEMFVGIFNPLGCTWGFRSAHLVRIVVSNEPTLIGELQVGNQKNWSTQPFGCFFCKGYPFFKMETKDKPCMWRMCYL